MAEVKIDEKTLREMAEATGGRYFRATDKAKLEAIYEEIDRLEKSEVEISEFTLYHEEFVRWVLAALVLLAAEFLLSHFVFRKIP